MSVEQSRHQDSPWKLFFALRSGFGELALLYSAPRAATVRAVTACRLWVMERAVYTTIKRTYTAQLAAEKRALLDRVPMLRALTTVCARSSAKQKLQSCPILKGHAQCIL